MQHQGGPSLEASWTGCFSWGSTLSLNAPRRAFGLGVGDARGSSGSWDEYESEGHECNTEGRDWDQVRPGRCPACRYVAALTPGL